MKKIIKILSSFTLFVILSFMFSSFIPAPTPPAGENGVVVEVMKGHWILTIDDCNGGLLEIPCNENPTTTQRKDGVFHMVTMVFQLPEGHCFIPDFAVKEVYDYGDRERETWLWTPDGKIIVKYINN